MAVYSPITKIELESFLKQYSIGSLITFEGILEGIENTNYKIKTSNNMYILTIFEKRVNPDDLPFFINLKNHLSKKKFECPKPISNKEGKYINQIKNKYCVIISYLKGEKTSKVENLLENPFCCHSTRASRPTKSGLDRSTNASSPAANGVIPRSISVPLSKMPASIRRMPMDSALA